MQISRYAVSVLGVVSFAWGSASAPARAEEEHTAEADDHPSARVGAIAGIGFPEPLAIEAMVKTTDLFAFGVEYGVLPTTTIDNVQTSLWTLAGDVRVFPFRTGFFVGVRSGFQHVGADTTITVAPYGSAPESLALDSWFINPRVGFLFMSRDGLAVGIDAGVQIPLTSTVTSSLPLELAPDAQRTADTLGSSCLPTIDLFRLGLFL